MTDEYLPCVICSAPTIGADDTCSPECEQKYGDALEDLDRQISEAFEKYYKPDEEIDDDRDPLTLEDIGR